MLGQRIINNILGNKPKADTKSRNMGKKYDITINGDYLRYGKTYVYANNIQEAIKKAKEVYPGGKNVSVALDLEDEEKLERGEEI